MSSSSSSSDEEFGDYTSPEFLLDEEYDNQPTRVVRQQETLTEEEQLMEV